MPADADTSASFETTLAVVKRRVDEWQAGGQSWPMAVSGLVTILLGSAGLRMGSPLLGFSAMVLGALLVVLTRVRQRRRSLPIKQRRQVKVTVAGIEVEGGTIIPAASIADAYFQPRSGVSSTVCCRDRKGTLLFEAEVGNASEGEAFIRALGHDVSHRRQSFVVRPIDRWATLRVLPIVAPTVLATSALLSGGSSVVVVAALALQLGLLLFADAALGDAVVEVGADGLSVGGARSMRFISYDRVRAVEALGSALKVVLADGKFVSLVIRRHGLDGALERDALLARIERARAAYAERVREAAPLTDRLARGKRPVREWRQEVAAIQEPQADYRHAPVAEQDLWRVVESAGAAEDVRAAAAVALRTQPDANQRIRVAAEAVASPKLRVALETAADPEADERALDEALQALDTQRRA